MIVPMIYHAYRAHILQATRRCVVRTVCTPLVCHRVRSLYVQHTTAKCGSKRGRARPTVNLKVKKSVTETLLILLCSLTKHRPDLWSSSYREFSAGITRPICEEAICKSKHTTTENMRIGKEFQCEINYKLIFWLDRFYCHLIIDKN